MLCDDLEGCGGSGEGGSTGRGHTHLGSADWIGHLLLMVETLSGNIATSLFDPSMSALPIIVKQNSPSVGLFTH